MTYKEIVYMCLDTLKITSDDSVFNEDHILFLINRYRSILLQQKYADIRNPVSTSNYQTLCLDLTLDDTKSKSTSPVNLPLESLNIPTSIIRELLFTSSILLFFDTSL